MRSEVMNNRTGWRGGKRKRKRGCDSQTLTSSDRQCNQQSQGDAYFRVADFLLKPTKGRKNRYWQVSRFCRIRQRLCLSVMCKWGSGVCTICRELALADSESSQDKQPVFGRRMDPKFTVQMLDYILRFLLWILFLSFSHSSTLPWPFFTLYPFASTRISHLTSHIAQHYYILSTLFQSISLNIVLFSPVTA